jgi:hypothetical protein
MVVQTRFFSFGLSISHAKRRPPAAPQRSAHVRGDHPARGLSERISRSSVAASARRWRKLLDSIPTTTLRNLRDRALLATLTYTKS